MRFRITSRLALFVFMVAATDLFAGVPKQISHQGVVTVNGQRFTGNNAKFYFALVSNGGAGANLWTNDGTNIGNSNRPNAGVSGIMVVDGVYNVNLGGGGGTMSEIEPTVFNNANVVLRIWFDDGNPAHGVQQLVPDQLLGTAPYAAIAADSALLQGRSSTDIVPIGTILAWHQSFPNTPALPSGWVECNGQSLSGPEFKDSPYFNQTTPNLNGQARFLRGTISETGVEQDDAFQGHWHNLGIHFQGYSAGVRGWDIHDMNTVNRFFNNRVREAISDGVHGTPRVASETRPINMSIRWIIKVK